MGFLLVGLVSLVWLRGPGSPLPTAVRSRPSSRRGFIGLCLYLALLYGLSYFVIKPEGLPSIRVQLFTLVFYAAGDRWSLDASLSGAVTRVQPGRRGRSSKPRLILTLFALVLGLGFLFSWFRDRPGLFMPVVVNFVIWTLLGFLLSAIAFSSGVREFRGRMATG